MSKNTIPCFKFLGTSALVFLFSFTPAAVTFAQSTASSTDNSQKVTIDLSMLGKTARAWIDFLRQQQAGGPQGQTAKDAYLGENCSKTDFYANYVDYMQKDSEHWANPNLTITLPSGYTADDFKQAFSDYMKSIRETPGNLQLGATSTTIMQNSSPNIDNTLGVVIQAAENIVSQHDFLVFAACPSIPPMYFPPSTIVNVITSGNKCPVNSTLPPSDKYIEGQYKYQGKLNTYTLAYKSDNKTLTWFGGPADAGLLRRTGNTIGSVTHENLIKLRGYYAAYPLAQYLKSKSKLNFPPKVILPKEIERGENNTATNNVINGKCLHVYKKCSANGKKAELWLRIVDRGPKDNDAPNIIDISPAAHKNLLQQEGSSGDELTGYGVQLEDCRAN